MLEEFTVGTGLGNLFSNPELFSVAHDYGRMRNSGEFGTRECGRGYSWSLLKPKYVKVNLIIPHQASTGLPKTLTIKQPTQLQTLLSGSTKP